MDTPIGYMTVNIVKLRQAAEKTVARVKEYRAERRADRVKKAMETPVRNWWLLTKRNRSAEEAEAWVKKQEDWYDQGYCLRGEFPHWKFAANWDLGVAQKALRACKSLLGEGTGLAGETVYLEIEAAGALFDNL